MLVFLKVSPENGLSIIVEESTRIFEESSVSSYILENSDSCIYI